MSSLGKAELQGSPSTASPSDFAIRTANTRHKLTQLRLGLRDLVSTLRIDLGVTMFAYTSLTTKRVPLALRICRTL